MCRTQIKDDIPHGIKLTRLYSVADVSFSKVDTSNQIFWLGFDCFRPPSPVPMTPSPSKTGFTIPIFCHFLTGLKQEWPFLHLVQGHSALLLQYPFSTVGALRRPMTYQDFWSIELNDLWSKKICRPKMMSGTVFILRWSCFDFTFLRNCKWEQLASF